MSSYGLIAVRKSIKIINCRLKYYCYFFIDDGEIGRCPRKNLSNKASSDHTRYLGEKEEAQRL